MQENTTHTPRLLSIKEARHRLGDKSRSWFYDKASQKSPGMTPHFLG